MTMKPFYGHQNTFVSTLPNETFPHPPFLQSCESGNSRTNIFGPHIFCFHSVTLSFSCYCARLEIVSENMKVSTFEFESHAVPYGVYHCEEILAQWSLLNGHWQRQWPGQNWFYRCHLKNIYRHLNFLSKCSLIPHNSAEYFQPQYHILPAPPSSYTAPAKLFLFPSKMSQTQLCPSHIWEYHLLYLISWSPSSSSSPSPWQWMMPNVPFKKCWNKRKDTTNVKPKMLELTLRFNFYHCYVGGESVNWLVSISHLQIFTLSEIVET